MSYRGRSKGSYKGKSRKGKIMGTKSKNATITHELTIKTTPSVKVTVEKVKPQNPTEISMTELKDPHSGSPLEPPLKYGSTTLYSPYSGHFSNLNIEGTQPVEARFATLHRESKEIALRYLNQAADKVRNSSKEEDVKEAWRLFDQALRMDASRDYPEADLDKDAQVRALLEISNLISNDIQSARESTGLEKQNYLESARKRILTSASVLSN